jgi:hypothetical protein
MMAFADTFVRVHQEESWTHRIQGFKSESPEKRIDVERSGSTGRSWKRDSCLNGPKTPRGFQSNVTQIWQSDMSLIILVAGKEVVGSFFDGGRQLA